VESSELMLLKLRGGGGGGKRGIETSVLEPVSERNAFTCGDYCNGQAPIRYVYSTVCSKLFIGLSVCTTVEPGYNDIGLYDASSITSGILRYQLIPHC
jgi:hypothetical protein